MLASLLDEEYIRCMIFENYVDYFEVEITKINGVKVESKRVPL